MIRKTGLVLSILMLAACTEEPIVLGKADYSTSPAMQCKGQQLSGKAGISNEQQSASKIKYSIRTPSNYDSRYAHPLLVVFPAATHGSRATERFTKFTLPATSSGFIVVYPGRNRLNTKVIEQLGEVSASVSQKWCVDAERVFYTGHSDGGTISNALAFFDATRNTAASIAPSAAGMRSQDLNEYACPESLSVMVMHSKDDGLFPGYGRQAAQWWAACNQCASQSRSIGGGCEEYGACADGVKTIFCEGEGSHTTWPDRNQQILDFFLNVKGAAPAADS